MFNEYLGKSEYINYDDITVKKQADLLKKESDDALSLIEKTYLFVRDRIGQKRIFWRHYSEQTAFLPDSVINV